VIDDYQTIEMPFGARILSVGNQNDKLCLWALVNPVNSCEGRVIRIIGTGHSIESNNQIHSFIGTVAMSSGKLIWHVFEQGEQI